MQQMVIYWKSIVSQHVSGIFMPIIRRSDCVPLLIVVCPVVAVVMLQSRVARCVHCVENVFLLPCLHCIPTSMAQYIHGAVPNFMCRSGFISLRCRCCSKMLQVVAVSDTFML